MSIDFQKLGYQATRLMLGEAFADMLWQPDCVMREDCVIMAAPDGAGKAKLPAKEDIQEMINTYCEKNPSHCLQDVLGPTKRSFERERARWQP